MISTRLRFRVAISRLGTSLGSVLKLNLFSARLLLGLGRLGGLGGLVFALVAVLLMIAGDWLIV